MKKSLKKRKHQPKLRQIRDHISILLLYNPQSAYHYKDAGWIVYYELLKKQFIHQGVLL